jgi:outer membrane protein
MKNYKWTKLIWFVILFGFSMQAQIKKWTLEDCVIYAIENNISIKNTALDGEIADIEKKGAIGNFLPSVNASGSHSWNIGLNQNITTGLLENQTIQFTSARLQVGVDLYNGLQNQNRFRRANLSKLATQYQLTKMQEDISLNVANAFLQILFNKENLKVQKERLDNDVKQMERSEQLLEAGIIPRVDLLDMKATVASDQQLVIAAENNLLISRLSLAQLLQLDDFVTFDIVDDEYEAPDNEMLLKTPVAIYEKAKETRVELKIARANLDIAEKDLTISKGAFQPTLSGFYSFDTRAASSPRIIGFQVDPVNPTSPIGVVEGTDQVVVQPNFQRLTGGPLAVFDQFDANRGQGFGMQLTIPILNGFAARTNVERSKVAVERSKIAYDQEELNLQRNVYTAFTDTKGALNSYEAALITLEAREEAFSYAKERFDVGVMNAFDYNQSLTLFTNAQSEVLRTKYDYIFKTKILEFYFGIPIIQKP